MRFLIAALVLLLLKPAAAATTNYPIDIILPLTGPAAFAGHSQEQAARVYEAIVNKGGGIHGQPLHFEIHDDQSNPTVAVQIVNELLVKRPVVILGPSVTATCAAVSPLFANGPVNFCFSPAIVPAHGSYVFASSGHASIAGLCRIFTRDETRLQTTRRPDRHRCQRTTGSQIYHRCAGPAGKPQSAARRHGDL